MPFTFKSSLLYDDEEESLVNTKSKNLDAKEPYFNNMPLIGIIILK
jgi:hypothetical protein